MKKNIILFVFVFVFFEAPAKNFILADGQYKPQKDLIKVNSIGNLSKIKFESGDTIKISCEKIWYGNLYIYTEDFIKNKIIISPDEKTCHGLKPEISGLRIAKIGDNLSNYIINDNNEVTYVFDEFKQKISPARVPSSGRMQFSAQNAASYIIIGKSAQFFWNK